MGDLDLILVGGIEMTIRLLVHQWRARAADCRSGLAFELDASRRRTRALDLRCWPPIPSVSLVPGPIECDHDSSEMADGLRMVAPDKEKLCCFPFAILSSSHGSALALRLFVRFSSFRVASPMTIVHADAGRTSRPRSWSTS